MRIRKFVRVPAAAALLSWPVVCAASTGAVRPVIPPPAAAMKGRDPGVDWPKYCADAAMTGQARGETRISVSTIPTLRLAWKARLSGPVASSPTVVSGKVYVGDWGGEEWAFDAASGTVLASANLGTTAANCTPPALGITSAPAFDRGRLFLAGGDDSFYALDPETLGVLWKTKLGDNSPAGGYYGWCSPSPAGGLLYQGISSNCDNPFVDGRVVALDGFAGTVVSAADLSQTSDPARFGAGVWSSPAVDLAARTVFVTTASAYAYGDGLAYSIVRLSLNSLAIEDFWKIPPADYQAVSDADWGSSPTLFRDAAGRRLVGAGQKDGNYYAFQRNDLASGPVWKAALAAGGECPQCGQGSISTAAFDGSFLYVGGGAAQVGSSQFPGSVSALDPADGASRWSYVQVDGPVLAPVSVANGVVFAAAGTEILALDARNGAPLWRFNAGTTLYGGVAISDGRIFFGDMAGNLYAFEVPGASG